MCNNVATKKKNVIERKQIQEVKGSRETPNRYQETVGSCTVTAGGAHGKREDPERQRRQRRSGPSGGREDNDVNIKIFEIRPLRKARAWLFMRAVYFARSRA